MDAIAFRYKIIFINFVVHSNINIYFIFENRIGHTCDSFYIVGLCMLVNINCMSIIVDSMVIVVTIKNYHHNHHHTACRILGLVTPFGPVKSREFVGGVILGFVSHVVNIS